MPVTLTKRQATRIIGDLNAVLPRRCSIPVLEHVLFESGDQGEVRITATDLDQTLTVRVASAHSATHDKFLLPFSELKTLKTMPGNGTVVFRPTTEDSVVCTVSGGDHSFSRTVATMPVSEFPETAVEAELTECDLGAFLCAFRGAAFAAAVDPTRPGLDGVYADPDRKALVGTDGRRLTIRPLADFPLPGDVILPRTKVLRKRFPDTERGRIGLRTDKNDRQILVLATDDLTYSCKCQEGTYPNYGQVVPDMIDYTSTFTFGPAGLEAMGSLASLFDKTTNNTLCLFGRGDRIAIGVEDETGNRTVLVLPDCRFDGVDSNLAVNGGLLLEALRHGFTVMHARIEHAPLLFDDGRQGLHVLMPLLGELTTGLREAAETELKQVGCLTAQTTPQENQPVTETPTTPPKPKNTAPPPHNLEFVESQDPVALLEQLAADSQEAVRQAQIALREFKKQVRIVKTHYRDREKQLGGREKEMAKSLSLIQRLQETIAA